MVGIGIIPAWHQNYKNDPQGNGMNHTSPNCVLPF